MSCHTFTCGDVAGCKKCRAATTVPELARSLGRPVPAGSQPPTVSPRPPCTHEGAVLEWCTSCGTRDGRHVRDCDLHDRCTREPVGPAVRACTFCPDYRPAAASERAGVVVGVYKWPSLIDLQVRSIRRSCGPVPILISSDDPASAARCRTICAAYPDVTFQVSNQRIGHTGGDLAAFRRGLIWAAGRGLAVVAKLSQRMVVTRHRWLQDGAAELLASGLSLASRRCRGIEVFDLRTEACLLDVARWHTPAVLARLAERRYWDDAPRGLSAETVIGRVLRDCVGDHYWPWGLLAADRHERRDGVMWHHTHTAAEYSRRAADLGVTLDSDFHVEGWQRELAAGVYSHG